MAAVAALLLAAGPFGAMAEEASATEFPEASQVTGPAGNAPVPSGYAFDRPEVLADQLIWGVAHGVRLLGRACARAGERQAAEAWIDWQEREAATIRAAHASLARYYFERDAEVSPEAVAMALGLQPELALTPESLAPACATLAEALAQPRYDLAPRRAEILAHE